MLEIILESIKNLRREGLRTFLTLIGIVIGIAAIVSLISIGAGITLSFEKQFESIGANTVFATPGDAFSVGSSSTVKITSNDLDNIKNIQGVDDVIAEYASSAAMKFNNQTKNISIISIDEEGYNFFIGSDFVELVDGRWVEPNESSAIMLSENLAKKSFDKEINLRKLVIVEGTEYKVVGIFKMNTSLGPGGASGMTFMTKEGHEKVFDLSSPAQILIKTQSTDDVDKVAEEVKKYFEDKYGKRSITVMTSAQAIEQLGSILSLITLFVAGIAGISLVVGGIGIMNAMITSVMERTKEIGIYKAIGASNNTILSIFILEAGFIGLIGGVLGVLIGFGAAALISIIGSGAGFPIESAINIEIAIGGIAFAMIVGMLSGFYPALRASSLDPIDALRYE